jgi:hypothetical protein
MVRQRSGSVAMEAAGEPPPGKEPVMRVLRRAAVLMVLLGLSLGTPGISAAARLQPHRPAKTAAWSGVQLFDALWRRLAGWMKEGLGSDPLGRPQPGPTNGTQTQNVDAGCGIEPLGQCLPGH